MSCGVGCRRGLDLLLLWLWCRLEAVAPTRPLAWEPSYAEGMALKRKKKKKKEGITWKTKFYQGKSYISKIMQLNELKQIL